MPISWTWAMTGIVMFVVATVVELGIFDSKSTRPKYTRQQGFPIERHRR